MSEGHNRLPERCATAMASLVSRFPWSVVILSGTLAVIAAWVGLATIRLDADTNNLIADDRPYISTFREWMNEFGDLEYIYVVIDPQGDVPGAESAVRVLVEKLRDIPNLPAVHGWISGMEQWRLATRAMPESELGEIVRAAEALPTLMSEASVGAVLAQGLARLDPSLATPGRLASGVLLLESLSGQGLAESRSAQFLASENGQLLFVEIMPRKDYGTLAAISEPLAAIRSVMSEVKAQFPSIDIGITGKPVLQADELATSDADMKRAAILATILITILFMFVFRGMRRPLLALVAFAFACAWTYGAAGIVLGRLNLLSMVFILVLVGVGIDYGIHVVARHAEARRRNSPLDSVKEAIRTAGRGNLFGAATSAGVFFLALATPFGGLRELGVIAGMGLLFCALSMCTVLPALLLITERGKPEPEIHNPPISGANQTARCSGRRMAIILLALLTTAVMTTAIVTSARFEENLLELQAEGLDSVHWEHRIIENDAAASWFAAAIANTLEEVATIVRRARDVPDIGAVRSVLDLIPLPTIERIRLRDAFERAFVTDYLLEDPGAQVTSKQLREAADRLNVLPLLENSSLHSIALRLRTLAKKLEDPKSRDATLATMSNSRKEARKAIRAMREGNSISLRKALPAALREMLMAPSGRFQVLLMPEKNVWEYDAMADFVAAIRELDPNVTGVPITQFESMNDMRNAFLLMASFSLLLVTLIVWIDFRTMTEVGIVMLTLMAGLIWTIGLMALLGVSLNLANFFAIPILMGIGVDSAIPHDAPREGEQGFGTWVRLDKPCGHTHLGE